MKIIKKIIITCFALTIIFMFINSMKVFAAGGDDFDSIWTDGSGFIGKGKEKAGEASKITDAVGKNFVGLGKFLMYIGGGIIVALVPYMGIKYMISPPDKQAALKGQLIGVVVSGIVIFGAYGIWSTVLKIVDAF